MYLHDLANYIYTYFISTQFYAFQDDTMESSKEGFVIRVVLLPQVKNPFYHYNIFITSGLHFGKKI